jgi:recombinational DNA repair protein RecR
MSTKRKPKTYETGALDAIESGAQEITDLVEEMQSWYDNLPENLQGSERGERIEEAASTLEGCDAESKKDELVEAIEAAREGTAEVQGCPEHVEGVKCAVCKWDGRAARQQLPVLVIVDQPQAKRWNEYAEWFTTVAFCSVPGSSISSSFMAKGESPTEEELEATRQRARAAHAEAVAEVEAQNAKTVLGRRRSHEPAVPPLEGFEEAIGALMVTLLTGGRRPSRRDRLDDATCAIRAGCEAIVGLVESNEAWAADERGEAVIEAANEMASVCDDGDGVEFPGMYG